MSLTCPDAPPAAPTLDPDDDALLDELAAAAACAAALAAADVRIAFHAADGAGVEIVVERPAGERLRPLGAGELFALLALDAHDLRAWARRPELPIPGRRGGAAAL
jgi:hypothetical protein